MPWRSRHHRNESYLRRRLAPLRDGKTAPLHSHTPSQNRDDREFGRNISKTTNENNTSLVDVGGVLVERLNCKEWVVSHL